MRRLLWVAVLAAPALGPAAAQDIPFDIAATEACLAEAVAPLDAEACIGTSANLCMESPMGSSTVGMGFCLEQEWLWWDARLNATYGEVMAQHKRADAEMAELGATVPSLSESLKAMQRAWIPFRDAACDYERAQWGGGTGGGPATVACLMVQTGRQTLALESRLQQ